MKKSRIILFIDFDGVLFNSHRFQISYFRVYADFGVPSRRARMMYQRTRQRDGRFDPERHFRALKEAYPDLLPQKKVASALEACRRRAQAFVFADAKPFLRWLRGRGIEIHLISFGIRTHQRSKIVASGIQNVLDSVTIIPTSDKAAAIRRRFKSARTRFIFLDDTQHIVDDVGKQFPEACVIQVVRRSRQRQSRRVDAIVRNLAQARHVIQRQYGIE